MRWIWPRSGSFARRCGAWRGRESGILMVTHHLADILPEIDRVILMKDGRIFADGAKEELITREMLSALFGVDLELTVRHGYFHSW